MSGVALHILCCVLLSLALHKNEHTKPHSNDHSKPSSYVDMRKHFLLNPQ
ncbi:hypothetical protein KC19_VG191200 [Ceratodon purpureus]|uniref:Uncharacterized protein n=1 Tax=Ceratodon purpureus TaxID=3225 RepID=A0A8T0HSS6_CERPU|nr:hypothetical protein KC19_VG191200 [Ceratodon purpureus]